MRRRAVWKASTVQPKPGTPGYVFPVRPHPATPVAGYQWAFKPDGDDGAYYCGPGDFEIQGQEWGGSHEPDAVEVWRADATDPGDVPDEAETRR